MTIFAIVLAGGTARRLGGSSKPDLIVGEDTLLDLTLAACKVAQATPIVVVGPDSLARDGIHVTCEDPPNGGPAAGIAAGLDALAQMGAGGPGGFGPDDYVLCLACDMPNAADAVPALVGAVASRHDGDGDGDGDGGSTSDDGTRSGGGAGSLGGESDGAWVIDGMDRSQPLLAVYRALSLVNAARALPQLTGASMKDLTRELEMVAVLGLHHASDDVDTWQDADRWGARPWRSNLGEPS